jgi:hypothetical protein
MKFIKINESQKDRLFEAYREGFSLENLSMMADTAFAMGEDDSNGQMRYCTHWLGYPDNMGSSRAVYTLSDSLVLKLAYGRKYKAGIEQNRVEFRTYQALDTPLVPRILYHDRNFTFLVCENVVPAKTIDFEKLLGIPFFNVYDQKSYDGKDSTSPNGGDYEIGFDKYFDNLKSKEDREYVINMNSIVSYLDTNYVMHNEYFDPKLEHAIRNNPWLTALRELVEKTSMTDLGQPNNYGIVNRDGKPMIVILDSGFNMDVYLKHYAKL